jgi:hypothetical protein
MQPLLLGRLELENVVQTFPVFHFTYTETKSSDLSMHDDDKTKSEPAVGQNMSTEQLH